METMLNWLISSLDLYFLRKSSANIRYDYFSNKVCMRRFICSEGKITHMGDKNSKIFGYLGECFVQLELAKKNFKVFKIFELGFDMLGQNNARLEVKTALPSMSNSYKEHVDKTYRYKIWQFKLTTERQRDTDFFVCVVFDNLDQPPIGYFVFPRDVVLSYGECGLFTVFESDISGDIKKVNKMNKHQYFNKWEPILNFKSGVRRSKSEFESPIKEKLNSAEQSKQNLTS